MCNFFIIFYHYCSLVVFFLIFIVSLYVRLLLKVSSIGCSSALWLISSKMKIRPTERFAFVQRMFRERMFSPISGYGVYTDAKCSIWLLSSVFFKPSPVSFFLQGMDFTTDKLRSLVRKWQTLIEAHVDVKTTDNYTLRMFCIAFTKRRPNQVKRTCYAQSSQIRQVKVLVSNYLSELQFYVNYLKFSFPDTAQDERNHG